MTAQASSDGEQGMGQEVRRRAAPNEVVALALAVARAMNHGSPEVFAQQVGEEFVAIMSSPGIPA